MKKITILGTGAYGLSLALMFHKNNNELTLWTKFEEEKEILEQKRCHEKLLPNVKIPADIKFTTSLEIAVKDANLVVIALPAAVVDEVMEELVPFIQRDQAFCIASKAIDHNHCKFLNQIVEYYFENNPIAVISGPTFAIDMAKNNPVGLSLAGSTIEVIKLVKETLENDTLKLRISEDILGLEICGALKNVIAIASGILSGMGYPDSTKAMFITESMHDIKKIIQGFGGKSKTIMSFAGFGDILMTCTSEKSRNFVFGEMIGKKLSEKEIMDYLSTHTVEGYETLQTIHFLLDKHNITIPLIDCIYKIVNEHKNPDLLIDWLINFEKDLPIEKAN